MAGKDFAALLGDVPSVAPQPTPVRAVPPEPVVAPIKPRQRARKRFDQYVRKEARVLARQYDWLTLTSRKYRPAKGEERITENTLIRIAVDLLKTKESQLEGSSEDELRRSVGLS